MVSSESRDEFAGFLQRASAGEIGAGEYDIVRPDGGRRRVEMQAVPLRRVDRAAVVLVAMWDVTDRHGLVIAHADLQARHAALTTEHTAVRAAEANAHGRLEAVTSQLRSEQQRGLDEATRQTAALEAALAVAQDERAAALAQGARVSEELQALSAEWSCREEALQASLARQDAALREALTAAEETLRAAEANAQRHLDTVTSALRSAQQRDLDEAMRQRAALESALVIVQGVRDTALAQAARASEEVQSAGAEWGHREEALQERLVRQDAIVADVQHERDRLTQTVQELNASYAELVRAKANERHECDAILAAEQDRIAQLLQERDEWREGMTTLVRLATDTSDQAQSLLDRQRPLRLVASNSQGEPADESNTRLESPANGTTGEGAPWEF
jgi:hypothetical protein